MYADAGAVIETVAVSTVYPACSAAATMSRACCRSELMAYACATIASWMRRAGL